MGSQIHTRRFADGGSVALLLGLPVATLEIARSGHADLDGAIHLEHVVELMGP